MKKILLIFVFVFFEAEAQESSQLRLVLRSTTSISTVQSNNQLEHILQQSTGQASVSGTYESGGRYLSQGFVQNSVWMKMVSPDSQVDLKAKVYPNPFIDDLNLSFLDFINQPIHVSIFSEIGRELESFIYDEYENISMDLAHLSPGKYYIKVAVNDKLFVDHLVKLK